MKCCGLVVRGGAPSPAPAAEATAPSKLFEDGDVVNGLASTTVASLEMLIAYTKSGYDEDAKVNHNSTDKLKMKYPMLAVFNIPLAPIILRKVLNEIVQF